MSPFQHLVNETDRLSPGEQRAIARHIEIGNHVARSLTKKANLALQDQVEKVREGLSKTEQTKN